MIFLLFDIRPCILLSLGDRPITVSLKPLSSSMKVKGFTILSYVSKEVIMEELWLEIKVLGKIRFQDSTYAWCFKRFAMIYMCPLS